LFDGGAVVTISENPAAPLEIVHVVTGDVIAMDRIAISLPAGLEASIIERTIGADHSVTNNMAEIVIGDGAVLHVTRISDGHSDNATELSSHHIRMGTKSRLEHLTISTGRGLARNQVVCHVTGDDADANFRTATVSTGRRHADTTLVVLHDSVGARSTEVFRSAVGRKGTAIVQGRIVVERDAQQTDSRMMSNTLFLDDSGEMVNKPELEIFADDVQCGHGATSGDLEEDHVFYLRARGIPAALARQMLVEAFLIEALDAVEDEALEEVLENHIRTALAAIQPENEPA
ncbi:MAG: SufD family Fe-S cluster assembly protein, partial [Pseudomonadota bacterium]